MEWPCRINKAILKKMQMNLHLRGYRQTKKVELLSFLSTIS